MPLRRALGENRPTAQLSASELDRTGAPARSDVLVQRPLRATAVVPPPRRPRRIPSSPLAAGRSSRTAGAWSSPTGAARFQVASSSSRPTSAVSSRSVSHARERRVLDRLRPNLDVDRRPLSHRPAHDAARQRACIASNRSGVTSDRRRAPIIVEDNVWIGAGVIVDCGTTIDRRRCVAAGSVVTSDDLPAHARGRSPRSRHPSAVTTSVQRCPSPPEVRVDVSIEERGEADRDEHGEHRAAPSWAGRRPRSPRCPGARSGGSGRCRRTSTPMRASPRVFNTRIGPSRRVPDREVEQRHQGDALQRVSQRLPELRVPIHDGRQEQRARRRRTASQSRPRMRRATSATGRRAGLRHSASRHPNRIESKRVSVE